MKRQRYIHILDYQVVLYAVHAWQEFILMNLNDRPHVAPVVQHYLEEVNTNKNEN